MECRLTGETEVLGENLPQRHFCPSQNPTWPDPGLNSGLRGGKPATNRLSYGAAFHSHYVFYLTFLFRWTSLRHGSFCGVHCNATWRNQGCNFRFNFAIRMLHRTKRYGPTYSCRIMACVHLCCLPRWFRHPSTCTQTDSLRYLFQLKMSHHTQWWLNNVFKHRGTQRHKKIQVGQVIFLWQY
jgi:hypothetical protein